MCLWCESDEIAITTGLSKLEHTGLVLTDPMILDALAENKLKYLPLKEKSVELEPTEPAPDPKSKKSKKPKKETIKILVPKAGSMLLTADELDNLVTRVSEVLKEKGNDILSGNAKAVPDMAEKPCLYCDFRSFCRSAKECKK